MRIPLPLRFQALHQRVEPHVAELRPRIALALESMPVGEAVPLLEERVKRQLQDLLQMSSAEVAWVWERLPLAPLPRKNALIAYTVFLAITDGVRTEAL